MNQRQHRMYHNPRKMYEPNGAAKLGQSAALAASPAATHDSRRRSIAHVHDAALRPLSYQHHLNQVLNPTRMSRYGPTPSTHRQALPTHDSCQTQPTHWLMGLPGCLVRLAEEHPAAGCAQATTSCQLVSLAAALYMTGACVATAGAHLPLLTGCSEPGIAN